MVQVIVEATWYCPANCPFCPVPKRNIILPLQTYRRILRAFQEYFRNEDAYAVVISGGEPSTLRQLKDYVRSARSMGWLVTIVTNAFYPENVIRAEPDLVEISIDYADPVHHNDTRGAAVFDNAMKLLEMAIENNIAVVVRSTAMNNNIDDIILLRKTLDAKGMKNVPILVMPVRGKPELKPEPKQLERLARTPGIILSDTCPAGISSFVVTPEKEILACIFYRKKLGQLNEISPQEIAMAHNEGRKMPRYPCERKT